MNNRPVVVTVVIVVALLLGVAGTTAQGPAPWDRSVPDDTWHVETIDPYGGGNLWTSIAVDPAGMPHVAYHGHNGQYRYSLKYARFDGSSWQIESVDDQMATGWYPSLALDSQQEPHIAYHHAHDTLMYAHYYGGSWHIQTVDSGNDVGEHASLAVDTTDMPHIAYVDGTLHAVKYARRTGASWQVATVATMPGAIQNISLDLAMDRANHPHICYFDDQVDALKHAYYDGTAWRFDTVDSSVFYNGQGCSIAVDTHGHPHVSYADLGLYYAEFDGAQWSTTRIDNNTITGRDNSLALDAYNRPRLAYSDSRYPTEYLRYAYLNGFDWQIEFAESSTVSGARVIGVSLALDPGGSPHISYFIDVNGPPRHARKSYPPTRWLYLPALRRG